MEESATTIELPVASATVAQAARLQIGLYLLLVTCAWLVMSLWGLGRAPFYTKGEPREGLVVWEMTHGGGWILPMRNGVEVPSKPPLFHWLGAITSFAHGTTDEWSIRLPSAVMSLLSLWCVLLAAATLWGPRTGLLSALVLMTTLEWSRSASNARVDMTLTFGLQAAFFCLLFFLRTRSPRWLVPLYVSVAIAVLGKGFIGGLLPGLVAAAMILLTRDWRLIADLKPLKGAAIVAVGAGFWYVLALFAGGWSFFNKQILGEQLFTFVSNPASGWAGHRHSLAYLPGAVLIGLLPWSPFYFGMAANLWQRRKSLTLNDPRVFLLVWVGVVFLFYEAAAQKRSVYLLALYPAAALLLGAWWNEQLSSAQRAPWLATFAAWAGRILLIVVLLLAAILLLQGIGVPVLESLAPLLSRSARFAIPGIVAEVHANRLILAVGLAGAVAGLYALMRAGQERNWGMLFAALFVATMALQACVRLVFLPGVAAQQTYRDVMRAVREHVGTVADLHFYKTFEYGAVYYYEGHIPAYEADLPAAGPRFLLMTPEQWQQEQQALAGIYDKVELAYANEGKMRHSLVLIRRIDGGD